MYYNAHITLYFSHNCHVRRCLLFIFFAQLSSRPKLDLFTAAVVNVNNYAHHSFFSSSLENKIDNFRFRVKQLKFHVFYVENKSLKSTLQLKWLLLHTPIFINWWKWIWFEDQNNNNIKMCIATVVLSEQHCKNVSDNSPLHVLKWRGNECSKIHSRICFLTVIFWVFFLTKLIVCKSQERRKIMAVKIVTIKCSSCLPAMPKWLYLEKTNSK